MVRRRLPRIPRTSAGIDDRDGALPPRLTLTRAFHCAACRGSRGSEPLGHLAVARHGAAGGTRGDERQAEASEWMGSWPASGSTPNRSSASPKRWAAKSRPTNARGSSPHPARHRRCTWGLTAPACRCASPRWKAGAASSPTARPRPARSSSSPCGRRKHATPTASPNATPGRSATAPPSRARPAAPPTRCLPRSRNGRIAKRGGAASTPRRDAFRRRGRVDLRICPPNSSPAPPSIYHAKGHLCALYGAGSDLAVRWGKDRRDELDAGRFDAILTELRAHSETCEEARKCIDYLTRNRHRMHPEFRAWGRVSSGVVEAGCKLAIGARLKRPACTDRGRRQRHHRPAVLQAQRPLRGFLGRTSRQGRLTVISRI